MVSYNLGGQDLVVFFKPGTRSALNDLLIGDYEEIGATGIFDPHLAGQNLTFRVDGQFFVDNETGSVSCILGKATEGPPAGKQLTPFFTPTTSGLAGEHSSRKPKSTWGQASRLQIDQM